MAFAYLIDPRIPKNEGTFRPITVQLKQGTVVWPSAGSRHPVDQSLCAGNRRVGDQGAGRRLSGACPRRLVPAFRIAIKGMSPRTDRPFIWQMFHARGGGGASPVGDGWPTAGEGQAAGGIKFGSIEVTEVRFGCFSAV